MITLTGYKLNSVIGGDFNITFTFSDSSTSTQTIAFGVFVDVIGGPTAKHQLHQAIKKYAVDYQTGLVQNQSSVAPTITAILNTQQVA